MNKKRSDFFMIPLYVVHYTIFYNNSLGFKSFYRFFETKEELDKWLSFRSWIKDNCIIFKNIDN